MKRLVGIFAIIVIIGIAAAWLFMQETRREAGTAPTGELSQVVRGEYLARIGDCYACHTVRGGQPYAGGLEIPTPFGDLYTTNITPDAETGIGNWTSEDFWRAMHDGRNREGKFLYPAMPYTNYTKVTREDSERSSLLQSISRCAAELPTQ